MTIGSHTKTCKRQNARVAAWRIKGGPSVAAGGLPSSDGGGSLENKDRIAPRAIRVSRRASTASLRNNVQTSL
jgi:hypothetical protein